MSDLSRKSRLSMALASQGVVELSCEHKKSSLNEKALALSGQIRPRL